MVLAILMVTGAAFIPPASAAAPAATGTGMVKVLTWNIFHGGWGDLDEIADAIRASGADVVALQEVDSDKRRSGCVDQAEELAEALGMTAVFGANLRSGSECDGDSPGLHGDALLSRYPVLHWEHTLLPNTGGEQRGLLEAVLDVDGRRVRAASTHFEYRSGPERQEQAEAVARHLGGSADPVVVMGDLNGTPGDDALRPMRETFTDAWEEAGRGDGPTQPSDAPRRRIDYVFVGSGFAVDSAEVLESGASDHLPVRADLVL